MKKKIYSFLAASVIGMTTVLAPLTAFAGAYVCFMRQEIRPDLLVG